MQLVHVLNAHLGNDWGQIRVRPNIGAMLGQMQIRPSPGHALNAHSGNDWGQIPLLSGICAPIERGKKAFICDFCYHC